VGKTGKREHSRKAPKREKWENWESVLRGVLTMISKEDWTIAPTFKNKDAESKNRVISAVQRKYSAIQVMAGNKKKANDEEQRKAVKQQAEESNDLLRSLDADEPMKAMLATQIAAIHELQQKEFLFASQILAPEKRQYHINAVAKLSNVFIQQVALMQKLQGKGQQRVTVEHVHVHEGGQAIVGNVGACTGGGATGGKEKN
jgi:hypothetical protein